MNTWPLRLSGAALLLVIPATALTARAEAQDPWSKRDIFREELFSPHVLDGRLEDLLHPDDWAALQQLLPPLPESPLLRIESGGKYGLIDTTGGIVVPPKFHYISHADPVNGLRLIVFDGPPDQYGQVFPHGCLIDARGTIRFLCHRVPGSDVGWGRFATVSPTIVQDGVMVLGNCVFQPDGGIGFCIGGARREWALGDFVDGIAVFERRHSGGSAGYVSKVGQPRILVKPQFEMASPFSEGRGRVRVFGKHGFLNRKGEFAIEPTLESATDFHGGVAWVGEDCSSWIDTSGTVVRRFPPQTFTFDTIGGVIKKTPVPRYENCLFARYDGTGHWITKIKFVPPGERTRYAILDRSGREIATFSAMEFGEPKHGLFPVSQGQQCCWGIMDTRGAWVVRPQSGREITWWTGEFAEVVDDKRPGWINRRGEYIWRAPLIR